MPVDFSNTTVVLPQAKNKLKLYSIRCLLGDMAFWLDKKLNQTFTLTKMPLQNVVAFYFV